MGDTALNSNVAWPVRHIFYSDLDTVRFSSDVSPEIRKARSLTVAGDMMLGILVDRVGPMLSHAQGIDNQLLLSLALPEGRRADRDDRLALLQLARRGFIKVGLLDSSLSDDPPDGERYTLVNAFRTLLENRRFVLSGWPELNNNDDLRQEVLGCLNQAPGKKMNSSVPASVAARLEGIRELDSSLRQSGRGLIVVRPGSGSLEARVRNMLSVRSNDTETVRQAASMVATQAQKDGISLGIRSHWYRLIDRALQDANPEQALALHQLREVVDLNYNAMVGESLSGQGMSLSAAHENAALIAAETITPGLPPGKKWVDVISSPAKSQPLRWSQIPELLARLEPLESADGRLKELMALRLEEVAKYESEHGWGASILVALPASVGSAVSAFAGTIVTGVTPEQAASAAGVTGLTTLIVGTPVIKRIKERNLEREEKRLEERLKSHDEQSAIRTKEANWLARIKRWHA